MLKHTSVTHGSRIHEITDTECQTRNEDACGDVAQLLEHQPSAPLKQRQFPDAARDFFPTVNFHCRLFSGVHTHLHASTCSNIVICAHVKDPVDHVRVQWIMETLKHPACTVGWVA